MELCKEHSGVSVLLTIIESDIKELKGKWDNMQKILVGTLVTMLLNMIGVIFLILH